MNHLRDEAVEAFQRGEVARAFDLLINAACVEWEARQGDEAAERPTIPAPPPEETPEQSKRRVAMEAAKRWIRDEALNGGPINQKMATRVQEALRLHTPLTGDARLWLQTRAHGAEPMRRRWAELLLEELTAANAAE